MKYKKIIMLTIILAFLLAISAVNAQDNATSDVVSVEETTVDVVKETTDEVVSVDNDNQLIAEENISNVGSFAELQTEIDNVKDGGVLNLTKDYKYVSESIYGIYISKGITIDGKGHTIDGNHLSRIFYVSASKVVLKNINFANSYNRDSAGAIYWSGDDGALYNSTFKNSSCGAIDWEDINCEAGAVYWYGKNGTLSGCSFVNCSAFASDIAATGIGYWARGGAIYWQGDDGTLSKCNFTNSTCCGYYEKEYLYRCEAGAIYWNGKNGALSECSFMNSFVSMDESGDIYWAGANGILSDCSFINSLEGSISWYGANGVLSNSSFYNSSSEERSVVSWYGRNGLMNKSYFSPSSNSIAKYTSDLKIIKLYSSLLSCENISFGYTDNVTLYAYLNTDGKIIFNLFNEFDNKMFITDTTNVGIATLCDQLNELDVGTWNVTVIFEGNDNYAPCNATATITVLPPSTSLTIDDVNTTVGHEVTFVANVNSTLAVNEGVVTFFDGENSIGEANVVGGVASLVYIPSVAGKHTITANFNSDNYGSSNDTALLTVAKADVDLSIDYIADVYYTNPSNFVVNVNSNSKPVNEGKVKYYVNNELVGTVDVYEGNANFNYVTNVAGSFTLTAAYEETDNYFAKNVSVIFNVNKMPTTLSGESVIFDEESYKTFTTELKDNNNNGVGDQPVKIEVIKYSGESATFNGISDSNGITIYDVGRLAGGMWYVSGIYAGNNNYINSRFVDKFLVVRMNTTTEIEEIGNPKVNHNYKLKANIHDEDGKLVKEGVVQFYLDGIDIGSIDLSKNQGHQNTLGSDVLGAVNPMFEYVVGANDVSDLYLNYVPKKAGKHTLTAVYEGTTIYKASNSTTSFDVSNSNTVETSITASSYVYTVYNGGKYIVIKLKDVNGKAVNGVKVTVVLGGKTFTPTTKNGQAKVSTNGLAPVKTYNAIITFKGNSKYDKSTTTVKVVVKKATPKLTAAKKTFKRTVKVKNYVVILKTNKNKALKSAWVSLKVNKKTYKVKTNVKGQAIFKINNLAKKGIYKAVVKFVGNKYYNAKTVNTKIAVR